MTLDEAIKHCEEVEETQRGDFKTCPLPSSECDGLTHCKVLKHGLNKGCLKCASEHKQLAEWLKKLKAYESDDEICIYCTHTHDADYCNMCKHNTIFVDYFDLEGNADE